MDRRPHTGARWSRERHRATASGGLAFSWMRTLRESSVRRARARGAWQALSSVAVADRGPGRPTTARSSYGDGHVPAAEPSRPPSRLCCICWEISPTPLLSSCSTGGARTTTEIDLDRFLHPSLFRRRGFWTAMASHRARSTSAARPSRRSTSRDLRSPTALMPPQYGGARRRPPARGRAAGRSAHGDILRS